MSKALSAQCTAAGVKHEDNVSDHLPVFAVFVIGGNRVDNDGIKPATNSQRMKLDQGTQQSVMPSLLILICR